MVDINEEDVPPPKPNSNMKSSIVGNVLNDKDMMVSTPQYMDAAPANIFLVTHGRSPIHPAITLTIPLKGNFKSHNP